MHKHVGQKLKWLEIWAVNVIKRKPLIQLGKDELRDDKQSHIDKK